jgi:hypothetical protein
MNEDFIFYNLQIKNRMPVGEVDKQYYNKFRSEILELSKRMTITDAINKVYIKYSKADDNSMNFQSLTQMDILHNTIIDLLDNCCLDLKQRKNKAIEEYLNSTDNPTFEGLRKTTSLIISEKYFNNYLKDYNTIKILDDLFLNN